MRAEPLRALGQELQGRRDLPQPGARPPPSTWPSAWRAHAKDKDAVMTEPRTIEQHGSRIIAALEHAWAAIQDQHPDVPDVVIVTGAGSNQKGTPEGYRLRGHHWPERWVLDGQDGPRAPELFIAGELLSAGGRAVLEVMLHEAAHALATRRGIKDTSAAGQPVPQQAVRGPRGRAGPARPGRAGQGHRLVRLHPHRPGRLRVYAEVTAAIDRARLPFLADLASPARPAAVGRRGPGRRRDGHAGQARRTAGRRRVRLPARAPAHPAHTQADRRRPDHLRPVLRPVRAARRQPGRTARK